jgi:hypothetical protein
MKVDSPEAKLMVLLLARGFLGGMFVTLFFIQVSMLRYHTYNAIIPSSFEGIEVGFEVLRIPKSPMFLRLDTMAPCDDVQRIIDHSELDRVRSMNLTNAMKAKKPKADPFLEAQLSQVKIINAYHRLLVTDFFMAEQKWKIHAAAPHVRSAVYLAKRYKIPEAPYPKCGASGPVEGVGYIPCRNCTEEWFNPHDTDLIPKLIFQTWKSYHFDGPEMCENVKSWVKLNNEHFDYLFVDDISIQRFFQMEFGDNILQAYNCVRLGSTKADIWRLFVLYLYGGIYVDIDARPLEEFPLHSWGFGDHTVVTGNGGARWACGLSESEMLVKGCPEHHTLIYAREHKILRQAILNTLEVLAGRNTTQPKDVAYYPYIRAFHSFVDVSSTSDPMYMPDWGGDMGNRVVPSLASVKLEMSEASHQVKRGAMEELWEPMCHASSCLRSVA